MRLGPLLLLPVALAATGAVAKAGEPLVEVEGELQVVGPGLEPADRIGLFRLESAGQGDLRETPGPAALVVPGAGPLAGELVGSPGRVNEVRRVDPVTGRPLAADAPEGASCVTGAETACLPPDECRPGQGGPLLPCPIAGSLDAFRALDGVSVGSAVSPDVGALTTWNDTDALPGSPLNLTIAELHANRLGANACATTLVSGGFLDGAGFPVVPLRQDPCDGFLSDCVTPGPPGNETFGMLGPTLNQVLTVQQQAQLGCGEFYGTNCEVEGVALLNGEASALFQCLPPVGADWDLGDPNVVQPCTVGLRRSCSVRAPGRGRERRPAGMPGPERSRLRR